MKTRCIVLIMLLLSSFAVRGQQVGDKNLEILSHKYDKDFSPFQRKVSFVCVSNSIPCTEYRYQKIWLQILDNGVYQWLQEDYRKVLSAEDVKEILTESKRNLRKVRRYYNPWVSSTSFWRAHISDVGLTVAFLPYLTLGLPAAIALDILQLPTAPYKYLKFKLLKRKLRKRIDALLGGKHAKLPVYKKWKREYIQIGAAVDAAFCSFETKTANSDTYCHEADRKVLYIGDI